MRRLGAILIILGANIVVGSIAAAFWQASFECAMQTVEGACPDGALTEFGQLLTSMIGLAYWGVVIVGLLVMWWGKRVRTRSG